MPLQRPTYSATARTLHWLVALIVIGMIPAGLIMTQEGLPRSLQNTLFVLHKNMGVVVLVLVLLRLAYRAMNPPPPLPVTMPPLQRGAAHLTHWLLYLLLLTMAVSGYVRVVAGGFPLEWFDALGLPRLVAKSEPLAEQAQFVHFVAHYAIMALVALHVAAALYHGFVKRDGVLSRMWPAARS